MQKNINFIKKTLDSLKLPDKNKRHYFYDTKIKGLELMVTEQGTKSFKVYRKFNGKPVRVTLGKYPEMTIENARNEAQRVIADMISGKNPNEEKKNIRSETTFGEMFKIFMERHSKVTKKSWIADELDIPRFLSHWFERKLSTITKQEIQLIHEKIRKENGLYQANRMLARIHIIYNKAIEWGWNRTNPASSIKKFKEKSRDRFLHPDELPRFFESLEEEENLTIKDYVYVSLFTGARKSNVLSMKWEDINFERCEWLIPETKNGESLRVHLTEKVIDILKNRLQSSPNSKWVFESIGKTGHLVEPKSGWKRILQRADLKDLRLHDLRRTLGSWQATTGANSYIIGRSLGHKNPQSTAIYARLSIDPIKDSVEKATQAMLKHAR
ncbi:MAG: tyrosine-type recombinase/integrase [Candidatus Megaira endosymbiont of Mesostigma viride]|jgi:integrase|nr:MAG: tyrosine-type recombinase/integrase [Candidatus Megaira endosymbiont of Mesostigma viride]HJK87919.1 tyrosine-type recombinase/integrase [Candidatus Megaira endosymbiont of Mesostigma viride]